jgi:hypothetical protein
MSNFQDLFNANERVSVVENVRVALLFPSFVNKDENTSLFQEVYEVELQEVLHIFQKVKSPGPYGWIVEFFVGLYDLIGKELLAVVEESRSVGNMHAPLNSNLVTLIPKTNFPLYLDDFRLISL